MRPCLAATALSVLQALLLAYAQELPPVPLESTVSARPHNLARYTVLHNVLLREKGLLFYVPDHLADTPPDANHTAPTGQQLRDPGNFWDDDMKNFTVETVSRHNRSQNPDTCLAWIEQPAVMFHGMVFDHVNYFHFLTDSFGRIFNTVAELGFFDMDAFLAREGMPSSEEAQLVLLQRRPETWHSRFSTHALYDYLTPDQWTFPHGAGFCYRTLVIGVDDHLTAYVASMDEAEQIRRTAMLTHFARFVSTATMRIDAGRGVDVAALQEKYATPRGRLQIGLVSRAKGTWNSRAILNEEELVRAIQARYSFADVTLLHFNASLSESVLAVRRTNVLVGVHGAGLTNAFWMRPGGALVQLIPYGWHTQDDRYLGVVIFRTLAANANCSHFMWYNEHAERAWLNKGHGGQEQADAEKAKAYGQFVTPNGVERDWHYQDTSVEVESFLEVMDRAVEAAQRSVVQPSPI